jgi:ABC-type sulfate/molybdate transport systems ATPase subunit
MSEAVTFLDVVLPGVAFTQRKGERVAVAGETGSGKSRLLKTIGGLYAPERGTVFFEGARVAGPQERLIPGQPGIAYLSQHFELWHNYYVEEVLAYANDLDVDEAAVLYRLCDIDRLLKRRTDQLSGGERQRIALARLLVHPPRLLLLDEPFSNLDMIHKRILRRVIGESATKFDITCMLVSHDPRDVLSWADRLLVLRGGRLIQQGTPYDVYSHPMDEYTAALLGDYTTVNGEFFRPDAQTAFFFSAHP